MNGFIDNARVLWRCWRAATKTPVPGNVTPPHVTAPRSPVRQPPAPASSPARESTNPAPPAPAHPFDRLPARHGGRVKTIEVWADGRTVITDCRTGRVQAVPGYCPDCVHVVSAAVDAMLRDIP